MPKKKKKNCHSMYPVVTELWGHDMFVYVCYYKAWLWQIWLDKWLPKKKKKGCVINYFHMVGTVPLNDQSFLYDDTVSWANFV